MLKKRLLLIASLCLLGCMFYCPAVMAQAGGKKVSIEEALNQVKKRFGTQFVYDPDLLKGKTTSYPLDQLKSRDVEDVLKGILYPSNLVFLYVKKNYYTIVPKERLGAIPAEKPAAVERERDVAPAMESRTVSGVVLSDAGSPVAGASITARNTGKGTATDSKGAFTIGVSGRNDVLTISNVGFKTQEIPVGSQATVKVSLSEETAQLDEVVVIGYGTAKRKDFTGAVTSVKVEDGPVGMLPNSSPLDVLKGNVSGLNIGVANAAGSQPSMLIRGQNSINGDTNPLIVLDGVIFLGSLNDINPNDIASVDVLKDAVSASVYGSRSANGVIAITTKKGKKGKPSINLNASYGIQSWQNRPVMMNGAQWIQSVNDRNNYTPGSTNWMKTGELENYNNGREINWLDAITRTGSFENYQAAVSGASENVNYYLSSSYNNNKGIVTGDRYDRISVLSKINARVTKWLELGLDGAYNVLDYSGVSANVLSAEQMSPYGVMYRNDEGQLEKYPYTQSAVNPLWGVGDGTTDNLDRRHNFRLNTYAVVSVPWVKGLSYRLNYSANLDKNQSGAFYHENYYIAEGEGIERYSTAAVNGFLSKANGNLRNMTNFNYVIDNILNYKNRFGQHSIDLTAVATRDFTRNDSANIIGSDFAANGNSLLGIWGLSNATVQQNVMNVTQRANIGYLARLNYEYAGKYMLNASFRRDGASVFGSNTKWGDFGAVGLAWRISGEDFMKNISLFNDLKLKLSWGQNGNQGISPYGTLAKVVNGLAGGYRYEFSNTGGNIFYGLAQSTLGNNDLGWETTAAWNFGIEAALLDRRILFDLNLYTSKTTDQLFVREIPIMTGFKSINASMGEVANKGLELSVTSLNIQRKDFNWSTTVNYWINRNKLVHLYGTDGNGDGKEDDDIANSLFIGRSLGAIYGYEQIGIVQEADKDYIALNGAAPGDPKYNDIDGVPGISVNDRKILGYTKENFRMSISNTVSYKNFELYALVSGIFGGNDFYVNRNTGAYLSRSNRFNDNSIYVPYWTPENPGNVYPSATYSADSRFLGLQSRSFVRLQDVVLSYTFRQPWMERLRVSNLRLFFSGKNLVTFTRWDGGDPELGNTVRDNIIPVPTTYSVGFSARF
ncbi:SusC/RagA family TonB-linked outer membrane protein [Niabella beijingensis]|uniref:SusC/RagA family TonB-linked outer membrane protein n=1 Tax=Niabella beijingensis TaxID=2872700 RepID=UPI001CBB5F1B|nr:SusC/RagA family TonB-linked outer membrane protein [Niabella beijingensis]MBZ4188822.1 SusC/RagA family TonB-linked outer membrane protein [Niabella beijingensis]